MALPSAACRFVLAARDALEDAEELAAAAGASAGKARKGATAEQQYSVGVR